VMLIFTLATILSGALLYGFGASRCGACLRFVPYFVVGGFLAATGWLLIAGGIRMATGRTFALESLAAMWTMGDSAKLATSVAVLVVLLTLRYGSRSPLALPIAFLLMWCMGVAALRGLGLSGTGAGWYLPSLRHLETWSPVEAISTARLTWSMTGGLIPEMLAVAVVSLVALVTKVSSIELSRETLGNLDRELRGHGLASLIAVPFGGLASGLATGTSQLLANVCGRTRVSGVVCAFALGAVAIANFNLPGMFPIPLIAGLVLYLGSCFLIDAFSRLYAQRARIDLLLAIAIMIVCITYGYLVGVLVGVVCACVMFAVSCARIHVVRRHATRAFIASNVDRSAVASAYLRETGDAVQLYWLAGHIFFGSCERVLARVCSDIDAFLPNRVAYVVLDFSMVSGVDSSAVMSVARLRRFCERHGTTIVCCSFTSATRPALALAGFLGCEDRHGSFEHLDLALAWCEDQLLANVTSIKGSDLTGFESWLQQELGIAVKPADLLAYFVRKDLATSQILYREGEVADTVDLIALGNLAIEVTKANGANERLRRIMTHTVVGEMGFSADRGDPPPCHRKDRSRCFL